MAAKTQKEPYHILLRKAMDGRKNKWLSEKTGIHQSEISRIITGRLTPTNDQLVKISAAFPFDFMVNS